MRNTALTKLNTSLKMTIPLLLGASLMAGCGIKGTLKTPAPVFGSKAKVDPDRVPTEDLDARDPESQLDLLDDEDFDIDTDPDSSPEVDE